jgi:hypothetical protein
MQMKIEHTASALISVESSISVITSCFLLIWIEKKMIYVDANNKLEKVRGEINQAFDRIKEQGLALRAQSSDSPDREGLFGGVLGERMRNPFPITVCGHSRARSRSCMKRPTKPFLLRKASAIRAKAAIVNHIREVRERIKCLRDRRY